MANAFELGQVVDLPEFRTVQGLPGLLVEAGEISSRRGQLQSEQKARWLAGPTSRPRPGGGRNGVEGLLLADALSRVRARLLDWYREKVPYTLERDGSVLIVRVTEPKIENAPEILGDILNHVDEGGISEIQVALDDAAWENGWTVHVLSAFELNMGSRGIPVRILGEDGRRPKPVD